MKRPPLTDEQIAKLADSGYLGPDECLDLEEQLTSMAQEIQALRAQNAESFESAWGRYIAAGYQYGDDPMEAVRFGFMIARGREP